MSGASIGLVHQQAPHTLNHVKVAIAVGPVALEIEVEPVEQYRVVERVDYWTEPHTILVCLIRVFDVSQESLGVGELAREGLNVPKVAGLTCRCTGRYIVQYYCFLCSQLIILTVLFGTEIKLVGFSFLTSTDSLRNYHLHETILWNVYVYVHKEQVSCDC